MRTTARFRTATVVVAALATVATVAAAAPAAAAPGGGPGSPRAPLPIESRCSPHASLLGFTDSLDKTTFAGTAVSGLSALALTGGSGALALVDNVGTTPARVYHLDLASRPGQVSAAVHGLTVLRRPDGTPYTGADFDGEGLVVEPGGTVLVSSEVEPSVRRFRLDDGVQVAELPVPERFRVTPAGEAAVNQTFESLAATADGRTLYAGMEGPLAGDGFDADGRGRLRIIEYGGEPGGAYAPTGQYAYLADPELGLVELVALDRGRLLALERGFTAGVGNTVRVYLVDTAGVADVSGVESLAELPGTRFWLRKRLLVDLVDCPPSGATARQPQPNPLLDNVEGMALGGRIAGARHTLYLVSDDNSNPAQTTRVYALAVRLGGNV